MFECTHQVAAQAALEAAAALEEDDEISSQDLGEEGEYDYDVPEGEEEEYYAAEDTNTEEASWRKTMQEYDQLKETQSYKRDRIAAWADSDALEAAKAAVGI